MLRVVRPWDATEAVAHRRCQVAPGSAEAHERRILAEQARVQAELRRLEALGAYLPRPCRRLRRQGDPGRCSGCRSGVPTGGYRTCDRCRARIARNNARRGTRRAANRKESV